MRIILLALLTFPAIANEAAAYRLNITKYIGEFPAIVYEASCVAIGDKRLLTAKHNVMEGEQTSTEAGFVIEVQIKDKEWVKCKIEKLSDKQDLALLKCDKKLPATAKLAKAEKFSCVGNPGGRGLEKRNGTSDEQVLDMETERGMSGAPVFNEAGEVVGIMIRLNSERLLSMDTAAGGIAVWIGAIRDFVGGKADD